MTLETETVMKDNITNISVYADLDYISKQIINIDDLYKDRLRTK